MVEPTIETTSKIIPEALWRARSEACELIAFSLRYPDEAFVQTVNEGAWTAAAHEVFNLLSAPLQTGWAQDVGRLELHPLRAEATRLLIGSPDPMVSPFEGAWRARDDKVQTFLFVNPHSISVERFCKSCGLGRPEGVFEPLDHALIEFELLMYLSAVASGQTPLLEGDVSENAFPGGSSAVAYDRFMADHVMVWMPRFAESLVRESKMPFYRAVGQIITAFLAA